MRPLGVGGTKRTRQGQVLMGIGRTPTPMTVGAIWSGARVEEAQPEEDLTLLDQEGEVVGPHLQHRWRPARAARGFLLPAEARIEKASVVVAQFAEADVDREHLRREVGGDP